METKDIINSEQYRRGLHARELGLSTTDSISLGKRQNKRVFKIIYK